MIASVLLNLIYLFFPLFCYFIYLVYSKVVDEKEKLIFLDLALFSSYYFCARFGNLPLITSFLINVPILLALYKKRMFPAITLSVAAALFLSDAYQTSTYAFLLQYFVIIILSLFSKVKVKNIFTICKVLFGVVIAFLMPNDIINVSMLGYGILLWVIMYLVFCMVILFYDKVETIVKMYSSLEEITKEKKMYESLFKITHEIKNPLAVCKGYLDMFDVNNPAKANKYAGIINQEIDRTLLLLKDFSNVSKLKVEKSEMDVCLLLEDVCDEAELILKSNIDFKCDINGEEVLITGDYNRLKQVLINVIKNAKEAINSSGTIELNGKKVRDKYVITVKDDGVGMDKETAKKIGTAFYTTKKNGTGLGVCFSKEIIEKHNGTMQYFSKYKNGTMVKITLPINKAST